MREEENDRAAPWALLIVRNLIIGKCLSHEILGNEKQRDGAALGQGVAPRWAERVTTSGAATTAGRVGSPKAQV